MAEASVALGQSHPRPGWVEQDAEAIWASVQRCVQDCVTEEYAARIAGVDPQRAARDRRPVGPGERAVPSRRLSVGRISAPPRAPPSSSRPARGAQVLARTGLPSDPMFSARKAGWSRPTSTTPTASAADGGDWCLGTVDAWLLSHFGGEPVTEIGNASRTQLLNIDTGGWDDDLLAIFGVPGSVLPRVLPSVGPFPTAASPDGLPCWMDSLSWRSWPIRTLRCSRTRAGGRGWSRRPTEPDRR